MSMSSDGLLPAACESDVAGAISMLAMVLASGRPSALVDWNNNYGEDPDKGVVFHCSNLPKTIFVDDIPVMDYQAIIAGTVGRDNTYGTVVGRVRENPFTYLRVSTDDLVGEIMAYLGEGEFTRWKPSAATAWCGCHICRSFWPSSARMVSSTTWPSTKRAWQPRWTRR
jgi:L-fucose isomerase-like protein